MATVKYKPAKATTTAKKKDTPNIKLPSRQRPVRDLHWMQPEPTNMKQIPGVWLYLFKVQLHK